MNMILVYNPIFSITLHLIKRYENSSPENKKIAPGENYQGLEKGG
jgi:hypothetical protein